MFFLSTEINMRLFSNYACLIYQHSDPACVKSVINEELRKVDVWLHAKKLFIKCSKLKFLLFKGIGRGVNHLFHNLILFYRMSKLQDAFYSF